MYLTKQEESIYDGQQGWADQVCIRILVRLGELFGATRLIPIESAHISGVSYKTLGDAPSEFLQALANADGRVEVKATLNPQSFDPEHLGRRLSKRVREKQLTILKQFRKMGATMSFTCTPYYLEKPKPGAHLAWAESSAVVYANSVLGSWTNREGGPSALAAAIIGKTPDYGIHKAENRKPQVHVEVKTSLQNEAEFGALGIYLGKILKDKIPAIQGLQNFSETGLKQLGAALATTGMANMFYYNVQTEKGEIEKISVEDKDLKQTLESLSTTEDKKADLIFIGCPHCSLTEIRKIAMLMDGRKVRAGAEFWVCTSRYIKERARDYVEKIENCGGHVLTDMCTIASWTETLGIKTIMTDSAKTAYYAPTLNKAETILASSSECLKSALGE